MNVLVWFTRDLRLTDHAALVQAAALGRVLPLYLVDPDQWRQADRSARQWEFVAECLAGLRRDLAAAGAPLVVRVGPKLEVLAKLCRLHRIERILSLAGPEGPETDAAMAPWAGGAGIDWQVLPPATGPLPAPGLTAVEGVEPGLIPNARALRLRDDRCAHRQTGGRDAGLLLMEGFLATRGAGYRAGLASPLQSERASSRLSPYLSWGCLSPREVQEAVTLRRAERPPAPWGVSLATFEMRLQDRDELLQAAPTRLPAAGNGASARVAAWAAGETGLPFLDACLRYLSATGWLNFRLRAMVMAVAAAQIGLDPLAAGQALARRFTDYAPALHWPLVARYAGLEALPPRIDPVREGRLLDPEGVFIRRWVPELAPVPDLWLHEPWKWPGARSLLGRRYPEAMIDPASATRALRAQALMLRSLPRRAFAAPAEQLGFEF